MYKVLFSFDSSITTGFEINSYRASLLTVLRVVQKEVDRPTRLLQFVASVHLPFSFRSLDLFFVASLLFRKGTSFCVIRRK